MEEKVTDMHLWDLQREIVRLRSELDSHPTVDSDWYKAFLTFVDDVKTAFAKIEDVRDLNWFEFLLVKDICCEVDYLFDENDCTHEIDEVFEELDECQEILVEKGPTLDEFIDRIMDVLREYTLKERNSYYDVLVREIRCIRNNRSEELTPDVWGEKLRELEDFLLSEEVDEGDDKEVNQMLVKMSKADRLCCPKLKKEYKIDIYRTIKSNNVLSFFEYALYINILLSETLPVTLKPQFEAWLNGEDDKNPEPESESLEPEQAQEEEKKNKGGRKKGKLFKNEEDKQKAKEDFLKYIESQQLDETHLDCSQKNPLNMAIVDFIKKWNYEDMLVDFFSAPAVFRFLTEDCNLKTDIAPKNEKSYTNKLNDWLHK